MNLILGAILLFCSFNVGQSRFAKAMSDSKRLVCYHTNWSSYRAEHKFKVDDINPHLCTHMMYAYAGLEENGTLISIDTYQDFQLEGFTKFVNLKKENPELKVILSIGGSKRGPLAFSKIAGDPHLRSVFAKNSLAYLKKYGFDGLDVVWKYPNSADNPVPADKENFVELVKDLREVFTDMYSLSIVLPPLESLIDRGIDLPNLSKYVDFMTVLTYDYHKATEPTLGHIAPLYPIPEDTFKDQNINFTINAYLKRGADPVKLNLAIALYGISFILEDPAKNNLGDPAEDEGTGTQERGALLYSQFCNRLKTEGWTVKRDHGDAVGPYAYKGSQWISYDDEDMIRTKARYAIEKKLGGLMFWSIDMDDFLGNICSADSSVKYPLIKAAREEFLI